MEKSKDEYVEALYQYISKAQSLEGIEELLPKKTEKEFDEIMEKLIYYLTKEKEELAQIEDISAEKFCIELDKKIAFCTQYQNSVLSIESEIKENLIFASSNFGNNLIDSDISSIETEKYPIIIKLLERMIYGYKTTDPSQQKKLTNNQELKDCFEYKGWQIRIIYKRIDENSLYINLIKTKKSTRDKKDTIEIINRIKSTNNEFEDLKEKFKDAETKEKIVQKNREELNSILDKLNGKKEKIVKEPSDEKQNSSFKKSKNENKYEGLDSYWVSMYKLAKTIYENEGTIKMKTIRKINNVPIGKWLYEQKMAKEQNALESKQIELLEELGIEWLSKNKNKKLTREEKWMENYESAKAFYARNRHLKVPSNDKLAPWLYQQKAKYRVNKLTKEHIMLLEMIGIDWGIRKINRGKNSKMIIQSEQIEDISEKKHDEFDIDSLSYKDLCELKEKIDNKIETIKSEKLEGLVILYENMYKMFDDASLNEFMLMLENDNEGLEKIALNKSFTK